MSRYGDLEFVGQLLGVYPVYICTLYQDLIYTLYFATSSSLVVCYSRNMDLTTRPATQRAPGEKCVVDITIIYEGVKFKFHHAAR